MNAATTKPVGQKILYEILCRCFALRWHKKAANNEPTTINALQKTKMHMVSSAMPLLGGNNVTTVKITRRQPTIRFAGQYLLMVANDEAHPQPPEADDRSESGVSTSGGLDN